MLAVFIGPVLLAGLTDLPLDRFSPPVGLFLVTPWTLTGESVDFHEHSLLAEVVGGVFVGLVYAAAGLVFGWSAVWRFEREGRE
jgi:hypothetical protein